MNNNELFTEEHLAFRAAFSKFLKNEALPFIDEWEREGGYPRSFWKKMGEQGYLIPWLDEKYGGVGTDFLYSVIIHEELTKISSSLSGGIGLHSDIVAPYIYHLGTEEQKNKWLPSCVSGDSILAIAMTEPNAGSDLANITTTARREGDYYIINGAKTFITNGYNADLVVLACKTDPDSNPPHKAISLIVVEAGTDGFFRGKKLDKMGLRSKDTAELIFEDCKVPCGNLLGEEGKGFYYLMQHLQQERLLVALAAQVEAEVMLADTIEYTKSRKAFGKRIADFQHNAFKIAEMATEIKLGRNFVNHLIKEHINGSNIVTEVSMAKWWITEMANRVAYQCVQLHGGYGYMEEYTISRRYRDIRVSTIYAGSNEIMKQIISKNIIDGGQNK